MRGIAAFGLTGCVVLGCAGFGGGEVQPPPLASVSGLFVDGPTVRAYGTCPPELPGAGCLVEATIRAWQWRPVGEPGRGSVAYAATSEEVVAGERGVFERVTLGTGERKALPAPPDGHAEAWIELGTGEVLVTVARGCERGTGVALLDVRSGRWRSGAPLPEPRHAHDAVRLSDGRILVVGGFDPCVYTRMLGTTRWYDPSADRWSEGPQLARERAGGGRATVALADGGVLTVAKEQVRGVDVEASHGTSEYLAPGHARWEIVELAPGQSQAAGHPILAPLADGRAVQVTDDGGTWWFVAGSRRWEAGPPHALPRPTAAVEIAPGEILVVQDAPPAARVVELPR